MKKGLLMALFVAAIMITSLAPLTVATPTEPNPTPNYSITDMIRSQQGDETNLMPIQGQSLENQLSTEFETKAGQVLSSWLDEGKYENQLNYIQDKPSIMLMVSGDDPTLGGTITPLGSFSFGDSGLTWVHTTADTKEINTLMKHDQVLRIEADKKFNQDALGEQKTDDSSSGMVDLDQFSGPFYANDIIGASYVQDTLGYSGNGTVVNVMDSGVDFGHTALRGTLALTQSNESASFGGWGFQMALTNLYTHQMYLDQGETAKAEKFAPLHKDANGFIDTSDLGDMKIWETGFLRFGTVDNTGIPWMPSLPLANNFYVGDIAGNDTGYAFGIAFAFNGGSFVIAPFLLADTTSNGSYDTMHIDYNTAREYTKYFRGGGNYKEIQVRDRATSNFTLFEPHTNTNNQYLSVDYLNATGHWEKDGFNDISIGALSNTFDGFNLTGRLGVSDPIVRGIDSEGIGFSYFGDTGSHGTAVAGEIAAQDIDYVAEVTNDTGHVVDTQPVKIGGVAPDTDIIGTQFFSGSSLIYSYLWVTGYEPTSDLEWVFVDDHIANITSNSWGFPSFEYEDDFAYMFDFITLFIDMVSQPGFLQNDHPGIMVVFSSGNAGPGYGTIASAPLGGTFLMVGATTAFGWMKEPYFGLFGEEWDDNSQGYDELVGFSSSGPTSVNYPKVDVVNIGAFDFSISPTRSTGNNDVSYTLFSGTSEAAPLTSGALSLMHEAWADVKDTSLAPDMAKSIIKSTAHDLGFDAYQQGSGRVDVKSAVHAITNGSLPSGEELFVAHTNDSLNTLGDRLQTAFDYWYGSPDNTSISGYSGMSYPTITENIKDTALYGGRIAAGSSTSLNLAVDGPSTPSFDSLTFETIFNDSVSDTKTQSAQYSYYRLFDLVDQSTVSSADYIQLSTTYTANSIQPRETYFGYPFMMIISVDDKDSDGEVDNNERSLYNIDLSSYTTDSLYLSSRLLDSNTYVMIWDVLYEYRGQLSLPDLAYDFSVRAFQRTSDSAVSVSGSSSPYTVTISPGSNAVPGQYQGYLKLSGTSGGSTLVPYSYTVPMDVGDYATDGWTEVSGARNQPVENGVYGAVDYGWRYNTGDWRYYDLELSGTSANSLGLEIEWTHPKTMIDIFILDNDGRIIEKSDIIYDGAGIFSSTSNNPPTMQRFLLDVSQYRQGNTLSGGDFSDGYNAFTIALHAVRVDSKAVPFDPVTVRAAWVSDTVDDFSFPTPSLVRTGTTDYDGTAVTTDEIGIKWSEVNTNPIPSFNNIGQSVTVNVFKATTIHEERTLLPSELVSYEDAGNSINPEWTQELFLEDGMTLVAALDWVESDTDFDFIVVPAGAEFSFANDIFEGQLSTASKPEVGQTEVPASGNYVLAVEWFSGDSSINQPFTLDFEARRSVFQESSSESSTLSSSLATKNIPNSRYRLVSETHGWNFPDEVTVDFIYDDGGPAVDYDSRIREDASGEVVIGTVSDAVNYTFSLTHDGQTVQAVDEASGQVDLVIDAGLVTEVLEETVFSFSGTDDLGKTTSVDLIIIRSDNTPPEFVETPEDMTVTQNVQFTLDYVLSDASDGNYSVVGNGKDFGSGTWTAGEEFSIPITITSTLSHVFRITFVDNSGNELVDIVRISVEENTEPTTSSEEKGSIASPLVLIIAIVAIPIIRQKFR